MADPRALDTPAQRCDVRAAIRSSPTPAEQAAEARPRLGLALSGGGFRAAYFHLGLLARLAERGVLRHVEAISTVSGGSILGALYYLHVKNLLESKPAAEIEDDDYVALVRDMAGRFDDIGRKNLRARMFLEHPFRNFRLVRRGYSRTNLIGELYEELLYRRVWRRPGPIELRSLTIVPTGQPPDFDLDEFNAVSPAKLPVLLLNAANLTTGHGWRFEARYMGELDERDDPVRAEIDKNTTLVRTPWRRIPAPYDRLTLGFAVASSGAFPGLFVPSVLRRLFRRADGRPVEVKLMDGGVHDNQGVEALFDRGCNRLIVSDASAQLPDLDRPATRLPALLQRAEALLGDRVRELQLTRALDVPVALLHLEKGLPEPVLRPGVTPPPVDAGLTGFGVDTRVQAHLARVRTDLDSFSELESRSLSLDGYLMADASLADSAAFAPAPPGDPAAWPFGTPLIRASIAAKPTGAYLRQLRASRSRFSKPLMLLGLDRYVGAAVLLAVLAGACVGIWRLWATGTYLDGAWTVIGLTAAATLVLLYAAPSSKFLVSAAAALAFDVVAPAVFALAVLVLWPLLVGWTRFWNQAYLTLGSEEWARGDSAERRGG